MNDCALRAAVNAGDPTLHLRGVISHVRQAWPFFNRTGGADHFVWLPGDFGACEVSEQEPELAGLIKITHWGWHRGHDANRTFHRMAQASCSCCTARHEHDRAGAPLADYLPAPCRR